MRKLIVSMNVTLDGFMSGQNGELDWHFENWSSDMAASLTQDLGKADTIILGRVTYLAMASYWPKKVACLSFPRQDFTYAEMMNSYKKFVVSKTIERTNWSNTRVLNGNISQEIWKLKKLPGKNMIIYGSGKLVTALMHENVIDEYILWIHPVLLGKGKSFFTEVNDKVNLQLTERKSYLSGVVALRYKIRDDSQSNHSTLKSKIKISNY
jgi:dihydrofolate reductase